MERWIKTSVWMGVLLAIVTVQTSSSLADSLCTGIDCGNGTCVTTSVFPYVKCDCNPGWRQPRTPISIPYLACVIPNCTLDYTCNNSAIPVAAPTPSSDGNNASDDRYLLSPCLDDDVCGGGNCIAKSSYTYICQCYSGYGNLMNWTNGYCLKECSIQGECSKSGVTVGSNVSDVQTTSGSGSTNDGRGGLKFIKDTRDWMVWSMLATLLMIWID